MQAWALGSGVRLVLGKSPLMNMGDFPHDVWTLHRKLFHRFIKYKKYFIKVTLSLPGYIDSKVKMEKEKDPEPLPQTETRCLHIISLLSSSEEEERVTV